MRYKRKTVAFLVDAFQYNGNLMDSDGHYCIPDWAIREFKNGTIYYSGEPQKLYIKDDFWEDDYCVEVGDYIARNSYGNIFGETEDEFLKRYEEIPFGVGDTEPID